MKSWFVLCLLLCGIAATCFADRRRGNGGHQVRFHDNDGDSDDEGEPGISHLADYDSPRWKHKHHKWAPQAQTVFHQHRATDKHQLKDPKNRHHPLDSQNKRHDHFHRDDDQEERHQERSHWNSHQHRDNDRREQRGNHWNGESRREHHHRHHEYRHENTDIQGRYSERSSTENQGQSPSSDRVRNVLEHDTSDDVPPVRQPSAPEAADVEETPVQSLPDDVSWSGQPPPHDQAAAMARYIVHVSDWAAMATISTRPATFGAPFANVFSVADGTRYRSTGVPYMYLTDWEMSVKDLRVNNSASLTMSLAQSEYCSRHDYDPESPLCAHVIISGTVRQMDPEESDYTFARDALFARHPEMSGWPSSHEWFVAMMDIKDIIVLDYFGGAITVTKEDYFAASPFTVDEGRETNRV